VFPQQKKPMAVSLAIPFFQPTKKGDKNKIT
jgi:hypothetical protein